MSTILVKLHAVTLRYQPANPLHENPSPQPQTNAFVTACSQHKSQLTNFKMCQHKSQQIIFFYERTRTNKRGVLAQIIINKVQDVIAQITIEFFFYDKDKCTSFLGILHFRFQFVPFKWHGAWLLSDSIAGLCLLSTITIHGCCYMYCERSFSIM